ncbi:MAG: hypothetical protein ABJB69_09730 [Spartobacteria bacterium]
MASTESIAHDELVVCACGNAEYTARDAIEMALFRGDLEPRWQEFLRRLAAEKRALELDLDVDDEAFDAAAEAFRYDHDLITAEETEQWLAARELNVDDFSEYFLWVCWGRTPPEGTETQPMDYLSAPADLRDLFTIEMILSDQLDYVTTRFTWRLASLAELKDVDLAQVAEEKENFLERNKLKASELGPWLEKLGRDEEWFSQRTTMEAAFRQRLKALLGPNAHQKELSSLRLQMTRFGIEVIELESRDAAQEALFCVREDGMSMEEVAKESQYPYRRAEFILEDLNEEVQQRFLSVTPGQLLDPLPRGEGFELCRITSRAEPQVDDPVIRGRIEQRLMNRHFAELAAKHVVRRLGAATVAQ